MPELNGVVALEPSAKIPLIFKAKRFQTSVDISMYAEVLGVNWCGEFVELFRGAFLRGSVAPLIQQYGGMWLACHDAFSFRLELLDDDPVLRNFLTMISNEFGGDLRPYIDRLDESSNTEIFLEFDSRSRPARWFRKSEEEFEASRRALLVRRCSSRSEVIYEFWRGLIRKFP